MSHRRLFAVRWPTLLLLASMAFTAVGVIEASRAIRSQRRVAERALRDYAGFAAWSYQQHLRETLAGATQEVLGAVNHGDGMHSNPHIPDGRDLAHYLPWDTDCGCHRPAYGPSPSTFFGFALGSDTMAVGVNTHRTPSEGWEVDRPMPMEQITHTPTPRSRATGYPVADRAWINDTLTRQIRSRAPYGNFPIVIASHGAEPRTFVYTLMPTTWGDTIVYGAEYAPATLRALLAGIMHDRDLLPAAFTRGHAPREIMRLRVSDAAGQSLFESEPGRWALDDTTRLSTTFGSLLVRAQIRPELADQVIIGGLPGSRLPFLLGMLGVSAALALVALGQIRRENELARMRGTFVDSVSHELRTPLAQMRLYLETLRLGRFTTDAQRSWSLDNVERETTRLSHLVERVLRFSRVGRSAGGHDETSALIDTNAEVARIVDEFRPLAAARRMQLTLESIDVAALRLHAAALRHILLNLLDNAVKYGPVGQTVCVRLSQHGREVRIEVADEGPGVPRDDRDAIWRPYQRGRTAGHTAGSGIGLAIVRDVVAQHAGRAWIDDAAPNGGATFVVALPADGPAPNATTAAPDTAFATR